MTKNNPKLRLNLEFGKDLTHISTDMMIEIKSYGLTDLLLYLL